MRSRVGFCSRCGTMRMSWNKRYVSHVLSCKQWLGRASRIMGLVVITAAFTLVFPESGPSVYSAPSPSASISRSSEETPKVEPVVQTVDGQIRSIEAFLQRHQVREVNRMRLAEAIVTSSRKHGLNPKLLASVMIVESRGNPFAISGKTAVGVMQIHIPTWGDTADREDINLFRIEDNVDFGARILKDYTRRFGLWEGIKRYNGFIPGDPAWEQSAATYLAKVQDIFEYVPPQVSQSS